MVEKGDRLIDMEIEKRCAASNEPLSVADIREAAQSSTFMRARLVAMIAASTMAGLIPIL